MRLQKAQKLAKQIVEQIHPHCERIEIAGSIRRRKQECRDVDVVLIPKSFLWPRIIATLQRTMDAEVIKRGESIAQLTIKGVNVDLYVASPETYEALILIRTGSAEHNIKLSMLAQKKGLKLTHKGLTRGDVVIARTEREIFESLDLPYKNPEERG